MEKTEDYNLSLIEKFINLDLSESELELVEEKLEHDEEFIKTYQLYKESQHLVNGYDPEKLKTFSELNQILVEEPKENKQRSFPVYQIITLVAAAVSLLIISIFLINNSETERDLKLMAQRAWEKNTGLDYYQIREAGSDSVKMIFLSGFDLYRNHDYQNSINILKKFEAGQLYYEDALLIQGLSHYRMGDQKKAIGLLKSLERYPTGKKANVAKWYLGLIFLSENNEAEAAKYIVIPTNPNSGIKIIE